MNLSHAMTELVLELAVIIFAAKLGGAMARRLGVPGVLGELVSGILIGPFLLGAVALPGFPEGLFPLKDALSPVNPELYGFATVASLVLLFITGLETDLDLFLRYSVKGSIIGIGGVVASLLTAVAITAIWAGMGPWEPASLFLGVLSIATSVGITARILSERRKMDSPEGVSILAAAVIDDVLGIIILAVVMGLVTIMQSAEATVDWWAVGLVALRAFGVWLGTTALGLALAKPLSRWLKGLRRPSDFVVLAMGITFMVSGLFEKAGLAMIVGAYVTGLSLSKTDVALVIQEKMQVISDLLVPIFFAVMGMLVDLRVFLDPGVVSFGLIFTLGAILAKVVGAGLPSLGLGFTPLGALRIGVGMVPRGEVALIIAGIGFSSGILDRSLFGVAIMMTLLTTLVAPPLLSLVLTRPGAGTRKAAGGQSSVETGYTFASDEMADIIVSRFLASLESEGFFIHTPELEDRVFRIGKNEVFFFLTQSGPFLSFSSPPEDQAFIQTMVYESLTGLGDSVAKLKDSFKPEKMVRSIRQDMGRTTVDLASLLHPERIMVGAPSRDKEGLLRILADLASRGPGSSDPGLIAVDIQEREASMSTGLGSGIALPHAKTDGVEAPRIAVLLCPEGTDFQALDGRPTHIFVVILSPRKGQSPHLQILSSLGSVLNQEERRQELLRCGSKGDVLRFFQDLGPRKGKWTR